MNISIVRCAVIGYIRPNSVLVICCGLLAKWLRVRVRVRAGARECTNYTFILLSSGWSYKYGEHLCLWWFGSLHKYTTSYISCHVVTHFCSSDRVKEVSPFGDAEETYFRTCKYT